MQVLVVDQADEFGMLVAIIEVELDQPADRGFGLKMIEVELAFGAP